MVSPDAFGRAPIVVERAAFCIAARPSERVTRYLHKVNADGTGVVQLPLPDGTISGMDWSPDGEHIAVEVGVVGTTGQTIVMNADGSDQHVIATGVNWPAWSPDVTKIAYFTSDAIGIVNVDGSGLELFAFPSGVFVRRRPGLAAWPNVMLTDGT